MNLPDWPDRAAQLTDELVTAGKLGSAEWQEAFRKVPRHAFVPVFLEQREGQWREVSPQADLVRWSQQVYANTPLVTQLEGQLPTSSSSAPGLMARMLEALDVHDGDTVLEIGTGTGYNAALLCHRLGSNNVFSLDVETTLVGQARQRIHSMGFTPHLSAGDGAQGWPGGGTFDRVIATCAVGRIPQTWIEQTKENGLILADLKLGINGGNLILLRRTAQGAEGRFLTGHSAFMPMRTKGARESSYPARDRAQTHHRYTTVPEERPWEFPVWWFLACAKMPTGVRFGYTLNNTSGQPHALSLSCPDGSWCEVSLETNAKGRRVWEAGSVPLWSAVERARDTWESHGLPDWSRLGLTVTDQHHVFWLDEPGLLLGEFL